MFVHLCTAHSAVSIDQHLPQAHMRACGSCAWQRTSQSLKPAAFAAACKRVSVPKSCGRSSTSMPKSSAVCRNVGSSGAWGCSCNQRSHLLNAARALLSFHRGACKLVALNTEGYAMIRVPRPCILRKAGCLRAMCQCTLDHILRPLQSWREMRSSSLSRCRQQH